jgi:hypothetical protein
MKTRPVGNFGDHPEEPVGSDCMCVLGTDTHLPECEYANELLFWCSRCHQKFQPMGEVLIWGKTYPEHKITKDKGEGKDPRFTNEVIKESREIKKALCKCCMLEVAKKEYDTLHSNAAEAMQTIEKPDRQMLSYHTVKDTKLEDSISSEEEANYMKTPTPERSVEEIAKELMKEMPIVIQERVRLANDGKRDFTYPQEKHDLFKVKLTQTLQAERQKQATEMMRELYKEVSDEAEDTFGNGAKVVKQVAEKYGIDLNSDKK